MTEPQNDATPRSEALDWLTGRLRWERILRELHEQAEGAEPTAATAPKTRDGQAA